MEIKEEGILEEGQYFFFVVQVNDFEDIQFISKCACVCVCFLQVFKELLYKLNKYFCVFIETWVLLNVIRLFYLFVIFFLCFKLCFKFFYFLFWMRQMIGYGLELYDKIFNVY